MAEGLGGNVAEFSVSELSGALKRLVEDAFGRVRVRGEISGYRGPHSSGHAYFRLKDERAALEAVIWKGVMGALRFQPEEGMEVIATGKLTTFPGSSKYQIVIDTLEPAGAGALMALLEERRRRLAAEGLFDQARKRPLPFMPTHIGVITSPTGAVIRDILHRVMDRFACRVTVWPVRVQGETTGLEVSRAVAGFNAFAGDARPDVLIVARGGGSLEDLWGFNDEAIVRAVAASAIPVISAVGHETDWTLIDHAADMRAPTPTGAAEMAVPVKADLEAALASLGARLSSAVTRGIDRRRQAVTAAARGLPGPEAILAIPRRRFDEAGDSLGRALELNVERKGRRLVALRLSAHPVMARIEARTGALASLGGRLGRALPRTLGNERTRLAELAARLDVRLLAAPAARGGDALGRAWSRAVSAYERGLERRRARLEQAGRLADTLSHKAVLRRGYAYAVDEAGTLVASAAALRSAGVATLHFGDDSTVKVQPAGSRPGAARTAADPKGRQPTLFEE